MKALSKLKAKPGIWMIDAPMPQLGPNDILIKIKKTGICGTDIHIYHWDAWAQKTIPVPMVIGHEFMGVIAAIGDAVKNLKVGDRVSGEGHLTCGYCRNCHAGKRHLCRSTIGIGCNIQGCFADYFSLPATNVFKLPDAISDDLGAILDPLGNAVHTALSFDMVGEDVLITGAGPIGIMAVGIARHVGARHIFITDFNDYRLELARQMGATHALNISRDSLEQHMQQVGITEGFGVGLEMSGNAAALNQMLSNMNHGGRIAVLGIPLKPIEIDMNQIIFKGIIIKGIYGREMFETWYKMASMLQSGLTIDPVVTHHFAAADYQEAFNAMASGKAGKIILAWE